MVIYRFGINFSFVSLKISRSWGWAWIFGCLLLLISKYYKDHNFLAYIDLNIYNKCNKVKYHILFQ